MEPSQISLFLTEQGFEDVEALLPFLADDFDVNVYLTSSTHPSVERLELVSNALKPILDAFYETSGDAVLKQARSAFAVRSDIESVKSELQSTRAALHEVASAIEGPSSKLRQYLTSLHELHQKVLLLRGAQTYIRRTRRLGGSQPDERLLHEIYSLEKAYPVLKDLR